MKSFKTSPIKILKAMANLQALTPVESNDKIFGVDFTRYSH
jgi:hypothetical protein